MTQEKTPPKVSCTDLPEQEICQTLPAEKRFHQAVYGGISYAAQALSGIFLTHWAQYGGGKKPIFDPASEWLGKNFISRISSKKGAAATKSANYWLIVSTMVMVGNLFLIPVKMLEDRKPKIVRWINDRMNAKHPPTPEEREAQEARLTQIEQEPRQTWWSLGWGRVAGLIPVYGVLWGLDDLNKKAETATATNILKGIKKTGDFAHDTVGIRKLGNGLKNLARSKKLEQYLRIAFYDAFYSMVSAGGLFVYSHIVQPPKKSHVTVKVQGTDTSHGHEELLVEVKNKPEPEKESSISIPGNSIATRVAPKDKPVPRDLYTKEIAAENEHSSQAQLGA